MARTANTTHTPTLTCRVCTTLSAADGSLNRSRKDAASLVDYTRYRNTAKALSAIFNNYVVIVSCVIFSESAPRILPRTTIWLPYIIAVLVIASRLRAFENLVHEASHHNLFSAVDMHYALEPLYSFPVFRDLSDYRSSHLQHHKHLGDPKREPDVQRMIELGLDDLPTRPIRLLLGSPLSGYLTYEYLTTTFVDFWKNSKKIMAKILYWSFAIACFTATNSLDKFGWYYLVSLLVVLPTTRFLAEAAEHTGLDMSGIFGSSRSNNGSVHGWYLHPHYDGFHAAHHFSPQVPFHMLRQAHEKFMAQNAGTQ